MNISARIYETMALLVDPFCPVGILFYHVDVLLFKKSFQTSFKKENPLLE